MLTRRGLSPEKINLLAVSTDGKTRVTREAVLAALTAAAGRLKAEDEFWLLLYGHGGRAAGGGGAFQISGPRLTGDDLRKALGAISAHENVFIGTENSGAFLPLLLGHPNCAALSATSEAGEVNTPRFSEQFIRAWGENPRAALSALGARAAQLVAEQYTRLGLVQGEHARLADPATGTILSPPFGIADLADAMKGSAAPALTEVRASDIEVPKENRDPSFQLVPPSPETLGLLAAARRTPNADHYPALLLDEETSYTVNSDRSTARTTFLRVWLAHEEAVQQWADYHFTSDAPVRVTKVTAARCVLPDGSAFVLDPAKAGPESVNRGLGAQSYQNVLLPEAHAGCIAEVAYEADDFPPGNDLPEFYEEMPIQHAIPTIHAALTLKLPKGQKFRYQLKNSAAQPAHRDTEHSDVFSWQFENLAAYEPLPLDPPERELLVALDISSLQSWEEFETWFRRIAKDSDASDATITAKARELAANRKTAQEKVKAAFEFVSSLRYVAIEFGIHGFRPRTPAAVLHNRYGDCKDKANLLCALLREMQIPAEFLLLNRVVIS